MPERFVAALGHELRTPLQVILILSAKLIKQRALSATEAKDVATIRTNAQRMSRLVDDLLDFTRGNLGSGLQVEPRPVDLHQLCAQAVAELREANPGRALQHVALGNGEGLLDPDRMVQVVINLVNNALKYGNPQLPIRVTSRGHPDELEVEVHNHGRPISPEAQLYLFDPFRRATAEAGGMSLGLGLAIVKTIVTAHGGVVDVSSSADEGTSFRLFLPRRPPAPTP